MKKKNLKETPDTKAENRNTVNKEVKLCLTICQCYLMYFDMFGKDHLPDEKRIREIANMMMRHEVAITYPNREILIDKYGCFLKFPFKELFNPDLDVEHMELEYYKEGEPCQRCPFDGPMDDMAEDTENLFMDLTIE